MMRTAIGLLGAISTALLGAAAPPTESGPAYARVLRGEIDEQDVHVASDDAGNTVVAGAFSGTLDLGGSTPLQSTGGKDVFAAAYDGAGRLLWQQRFGGEDNDSLSGLAVGGKGTIYLVGSLNVKSAADLGGLPPPYGPETSILALEPSGHPRWATSHRSSSDPVTFGPVAADAEDNLFVIGQCEYCGTVELAGQAFSKAGSAFIARIAPDARVGFLRELGMSADHEITGVAVARDQSLLISVTAKRMRSGADFAVRGAGAMDGFVVKLARGGDVEWIRRFGGHEDDSADQIVLDEQGNAIITGSVEGTVFLGGPYVTERRFVATLGADGRLDRVNLIPTLPRLAANRRGEVVIAGTFDQPTFLVTTLPREGASDAFLAWLGPNADARVVRHLVGDGKLDLLDLSVDSRGQAVIAGAFTGTLRLGGTSSLTAGPSRSVFLAAFGG